MFVRTIALCLIFVTLAFCRRSGGYGGHGHTSHSSSSRSGGVHSYPHSTGLSGDTNHQGSRTATYQNQGHTTTYKQSTEVHHHYHYNPPQHISYGSYSHPVYHGPPPVYIYQYRDSGSRFDNLLTGLALYNLGRMSAGHSHHEPHREYRGTPGEICKLGISKTNGEYEETRIDCKLMSSFIWEADLKKQNVASATRNEIKTVNITQTITNGTNLNNTVSQTVTVETTKISDALQVKGPSLKVTPEMNCFMIRISRDSSVLKKKVECGLLQAYAQNSMRYSDSVRNMLTFTAAMFVIIIHIII